MLEDEEGIGCVENPGTCDIKRRAMTKEIASCFRIQISETANISVGGIHFMFPVISRWVLIAPETVKLRFFVDLDQIFVGFNACQVRKSWRRSLSKPF